MAAQAENEMVLSDLEIGTGVKFGNYEFIVVSKSSTVVTLLRDKVLSAMQYMSASGDIDYDGSVIDTYLTATFVPAFSAKLQGYLVPVTISYSAKIAGVKTEKSIVRSCFIPSYSELNSSWLPALKTFYGTTSNNTARVGKSGNTAQIYWTHSLSTSDMSKISTVTTTGAFVSSDPTDARRVRPAFYVSLDTPVKLVDGVYTVI